MSSYFTPFTGEISALTAALFWAIASVYYADISKKIGALNLNLVKGVAAIALMVLTLLAGSIAGISGVNLNSVGTISAHGWLLLLVSGLIGIAIGDTAYFACLKRIGAQNGLMLESTSPLIAALLALFFYAEYLPVHAWSGIVLTTIGVILVVKLSSGSAQYRNSTAGILFGLLAATGQATGIVLSRMALDGQQVEPLAGGLIRLSAGVLALCCWVFLKHAVTGKTTRRPTTVPFSRAIGRLKEKGTWLNLAIAVVLGTYLAIWLQQLAVKSTSAGGAQALLGTSPLFAILIAVKQGYRQPLAVWLGLALGMGGIILLFQ